MSITVGKDQVSAIVSFTGSVKEKTGIIIAHGAGNDMQNPLIVHLAEELSDADYLTVRFNFPYKEKGQKAPDPQKILVHTWQSVYQYVKENYRLI